MPYASRLLELHPCNYERKKLGKTLFPLESIIVHAHQTYSKDKPAADGPKNEAYFFNKNHHKQDPLRSEQQPNNTILTQTKPWCVFCAEETTNSYRTKSSLSFSLKKYLRWSKNTANAVCANVCATKVKYFGRKAAFLCWKCAGLSITLK